MPVHDDGYLRPFSPDEVAAMEIETFEVRNGDHPTETRKVDDNTMTRTFFTKWDQRFNFVEHVLGRSVTWDSGGTTKLSRLLPDSTFGRHPEFTQIMADRIEYIKGHGYGTDNIGQFPEYEKAKIQVFYSHAPYVIQSDAGTTNETQRFVYIGAETESESEAFTLPGGCFKFTTAGGTGAHGKPVPYNVSIVRPIERFTLWWDDLPFDLLSSDGALYKRLYFGQNSGFGGLPDGIPFIGCANSALLDVPSAGQKYNAGQLLLEGVRRVKEKSPLAAAGTSGWRYRVGFKFAFTPRGWLDLIFFNPATPADSDYCRVSNDGVHYAVGAMPDKKGLYNVRDMSTLFDPNY